MCYATVSSTIFWRQQNHTFSKWIPIDRVLELILKKKNLFFFKLNLFLFNKKKINKNFTHTKPPKNRIIDAK